MGGSSFDPHGNERIKESDYPVAFILFRWFSSDGYETRSTASLQGIRNDAVIPLFDSVSAVSPDYAIEKSVQDIVRRACTVPGIRFFSTMYPHPYKDTLFRDTRYGSS